MASVREPCEGSRHFIENGCKLGNEKIKEIELRLIDSIKFMSSSLDSLVNNLAKGGHEF